MQVAGSLPSESRGLTQRRTLALLLLGLAGLLGVIGVITAYNFSDGGAGAGNGGTSAPSDGEQAAKAVAWGVTPDDASVDVSPAQPVIVNAANGKITEVSLRNPEGQLVDGRLMAGDTRWMSSVTLGYGKTYTLNVKAVGGDGREATRRSSFTTVKPTALTNVGMNPIDGQTVGIGQPLAFYFDKTITDKESAEKAIRITTEPAAEGAFRWFSNKEVHWRPREYWKPGTKVTIDAAVYGKDFGKGVFGKEDRKATITIGDAVIARADGRTHQMSVEVNGAHVRTIPISMGRPQFPSNNGVHVVTDKHPSKIMDSTTYGLSLDAGGYRTEVKWATRISNGGEFLHAAPWSLGDQGRRNVSHGCLNMSTENAHYMYNLLKKGDVVILTNTGGPNLAVWDGFGDWQIPWDEWIQGSRG